MKAEEIAQGRVRKRLFVRAASTFGRIGGKARTERKAVTARENGKKGGRPPTPGSPYSTYNPKPERKVDLEKRRAALRALEGVEGHFAHVARSVTFSPSCDYCREVAAI